MIQVTDHAVCNALDLAVSSGALLLLPHIFFIKRNGWGIL